MLVIVLVLILVTTGETTDVLVLVTAGRANCGDAGDRFFLVQGVLRMLGRGDTDPGGRPQGSWPWL